MKSSGRPKSQVCQESFESVCEWLESEAEVFTLGEIHEKMVELAGTNDVYTQKWLKTQLEEKYKSCIFITSQNGKENVVCFRNMASYILTDTWYAARKEVAEEEAERIVRTAAKIILDEIRSSKFTCETYPINEDIESIQQGKEWLPNYLRMFMELLIKYPLKQVSIGQAIVNAARPRSVVAPILFATGVEMDHVFGSKWLLTELSRIGFSVGVDEVTRYKQSVVHNENITDFMKTYLPGSFTQWTADNVDHNVRSIDGKGTLHAMGIVSSSTNRVGLPTQRLEPVKRQKLKNVFDTIKNKVIPIINYQYPDTSGLSLLSFKPLLELQPTHVLPPDTSLDIFWHSYYFFTKNLRPSWSGYMTNISTGDYPGKSTVTLLPIIDLNPNDMTCIYSTLLFVSDQAKQLNIPTPIITFDQPLWLKATDIIRAKSLNIVCILGGFHTMMSFMGSMGKMMKGSGLYEALETIYGSTVVDHMMLGKDVSRALRAHFLTESALMTKLLSPLIPVSKYAIQDKDFELVASLFEQDNGVNDLSEDIDIGDEDMDVDSVDELVVETVVETVISGKGAEKYDIAKLGVTPLTQDQLSKLDQLHSSVSELPLTAVDVVSSSSELQALEIELNKYKEKLGSKSRTSKLWLQYLDYVQVLKLYIRAERTGNWKLHLLSISRMINLFASTGHINYAKSARFHLQSMLELKTTYPWVYKSFAENGYHTVRRSNRFWGGLWPDLIIEQVMMRSIKSRGGLTRGRGITESVRTQWISSMHRCAGVHNAMTNLTGTKHQSSYQHLELYESRVKRDNTDLKKLLQWFYQHEPFDVNEPNLKCIANGLVASHDDNKVNCDETESVGHAIQVKLDGVCIADAKIKRSQQIVTLDSLRNVVKIDKSPVQINPMLLFNRLIVLVDREENMGEKFAYELTPDPTSIFKDGMMRKPNKATLRNFLTKNIPQNEHPAALTCVIDGGALLHKVKWMTSKTFGEITRQYITYINDRYKAHTNICVVFDGYDDPNSTKAHEHARRMGKTSSNANVIALMELTTNQELFLNNIQNKKNFLKLLGKELKQEGIAVKFSDGDADVLIVSTAIKHSSTGEVMVVADDTDIVVLLMYHWKESLEEIYFCVEGRRKQCIKRKVWAVSDIQCKNPHNNLVLFVHAWSGCDTTSATHTQGIILTTVYLVCYCANVWNLDLNIYTTFM